MQITLSPQRRDDTLELARSGDVLTINGAPLDLSGIPEGATLPAAAIDCEWIAGPISRTDGELQLSMILPHGPIPHPAPPEAAAITHPAPITISADGPIILPHWTPPEPEPEPDLEDAE